MLTPTAFFRTLPLATLILATSFGLSVETAEAQNNARGERSGGILQKPTGDRPSAAPPGPSAMSGACRKCPSKPSRRPASITELVVTNSMGRPTSPHTPTSRSIRIADDPIGVLRMTSRHN